MTNYNRLYTHISDVNILLGSNVLILNTNNLKKLTRVLLGILMLLFNIPGLWLDNAVIFKVSIPRLKYHEIFLEF